MTFLSTEQYLQYLWSLGLTESFGRARAFIDSRAENQDVYAIWPDHWSRPMLVSPTDLKEIDQSKDALLVRDVYLVKDNEIWGRVWSRTTDNVIFSSIPVQIGMDNPLGLGVLPTPDWRGRMERHGFSSVVGRAIPMLQDWLNSHEPISVEEMGKKLFIEKAPK